MEKKIYIDFSLDELQMIIQGMDAIKFFKENENVIKIPITIMAMVDNNHSEEEIKEKIISMEKEVQSNIKKQTLKSDLLKNKIEKIIIENSI